ncbi:SCO family protein [Algicella marina]|uniref:SCO family protein n=1 Tax=Algicella marina TaxID=2683284 RepID=A0A6P1T3E7_9RHOB|nr:SCO family protein [Algicella marina]QHQ35986.1 SCO family protein [Algicella marina]
MTRIYALLALAITTLMLAATAAYVLIGRGGDRLAGCGGGTVVAGAETIGGPFELTRQDGVRVTEKEVITGPTLIYFGYTYCPDVCPVDTVRNAEAVSLLEEQGIDAVPVMITVDPQRDTPEVLADYTGWMHPRMIGLTGSEAEVDAAAKAYKVYYAKRGAGEDYLMDHLTFTYLMAPDEGFLDFFERDATAEEIAETVACYADLTGGV